VTDSQPEAQIPQPKGTLALLNPYDPQPEVPDMMGLLQIALTNNSGIEIIERLVALRDKELARIAETEFNDELSQVQAEIVRVAPDLHNGQTNSNYASYKALDRIIRPVYVRHGFSISFDEEDSNKPDHVRIIAYLSRGGHTRKYRKDICADGKGAKGGDVMTRTHAEGAADSYGMRYLLRKIFNIAIGEEDDDGNLTMDEAADFLALIKESRTIDELKKNYDDAVRDALKPTRDAKSAGKAVELFKTAMVVRRKELSAP
jgi:ERF superfamily